MTTSVAAEKDTSCRTRHRGATAERTRAVVGTEGMRSGTLNRAPAYGRRLMLSLTATAAAIGAAGRVAAQTPARQTVGTERSTTNVAYRNITVDGLTVFYREAGRPDAPTLLLLHGFPSSSRMYEPLLHRLADAYHLVAPDFIGFGYSGAPEPAEFTYTFDHITQVVDAFTQALGLHRYSLYLQDYGGPVGFRLALAHPERVQAIIVQNTPAHEDGLGPLWDARRAFWADRHAHEAALRENFLSLAATRQRVIGSNPQPWTVDPDYWNDQFAFLSRPGEADIQVDLFYDYRTNVARYPEWQAWLRRVQPKLLVAWGRWDPSFQVAGAEAYRRDVPTAEVHVLDAGHFALWDKADEIAGLVRGFLGRVYGSGQ